jgi:glycosyltransferase involved in cell wall biosynthesis
MRGDSKMTRYVIIMPVRDEEQHIEATIESVIGQTLRPAEWVIVDDGSTDQTGDIIDRYAAQFPWIRVVHRPNRGYRQAGGGVMDAFYDGYNALRCDDWEFIVKLDGDVGMPHDYFERCFEEFRKDPKLGIGGGVMYCIERGMEKPETHPSFHVRGPTKIYRRECWDAIGGLIKAPGWDTADELKANMLGWHTRSFLHIRLLHRRATGAAEGGWRDSVKNGRAAFICGYHPLFMMAKCLKRVFQKPFFVCSAGHLYGFATGYLKGIAQVQDEALIRYTRQQQMRRLLFQDSIWK